VKSRWNGLRQLWWTLPLAAAAVFAIVVRDAVLPAAVAGGLALAYLPQAWSRRQAQRASTAAQAAGGGVWRGAVCDLTADWLWNDGVPLVAGFILEDVPVLITASEQGLSVAVRGPARLLVRRDPCTIPWADIAGARQGQRRHRIFSGRPSLIALTEITIDVVGPSAEVWFALYTDDPDDDPLPPNADDTEEEIARELAGDDWRPGTAPLRFITPTPDGLIHTVDQHHTGHTPHPDPTT